MTTPTPQRAAPRALQHGDLTHQRMQLARAEADDRAGVIANTAKELTDPDTQVVLVDIPGRVSKYAVAKFAYDAIVRQGARTGGRR